MKKNMGWSKTRYIISITFFIKNARDSKYIHFPFITFYPARKNPNDRIESPLESHSNHIQIPMKFPFKSCCLNSQWNSLQDYHRRFSVNQGLPELQNSEWCEHRAGSHSISTQCIPNGKHISNMGYMIYIYMYIYISYIHSFFSIFPSFPNL